MPRWDNCTMETFFADATPSLEMVCEVVIEDGRLALSYEDGKFGVVTYSGVESGAGHWELSAPTTGGRGSLHRFDKGMRLDGFWLEDGYRGMWAVTLK